MKTKKAIFKFNNGNGAILCSGCSVIVKAGRQINEKEWRASRGEINLPPQYCGNCEEKHSWDLAT